MYNMEDVVLNVYQDVKDGDMAAALSALAGAMLDAVYSSEVRKWAEDTIAEEYPPLTEEQLEAIRKTSIATNTPDESFTQRLF